MYVEVPSHALLPTNNEHYATVYIVQHMKQFKQLRRLSVLSPRTHASSLA